MLVSRAVTDTISRPCARIASATLSSRPARLPDVMYTAPGFMAATAAGVSGMSTSGRMFAATMSYFS